MAKRKKRKDIVSWFTSEKGDRLLHVLLKEKESERGQVIAGGAFLDNALKACIQAKCKCAKVTADVMNDFITSPHSICSDFGAKITISRAFQIIRDQEYKALDAIRRIRNCFCHADYKITLDDTDEDISKNMELLRTYLKVAEKYAGFIGLDGKKISWWRYGLHLYKVIPEEPPSNNHVFIGTVIMIQLILMITLQNYKSKEEGTYELIL